MVTLIVLLCAAGLALSQQVPDPGFKPPVPRPASGQPDLFAFDSGLRDTAVTRGRSEDERVTEVATFGGSAFRPPEGAIPLITSRLDQRRPPRSATIVPFAGA